LRQDVCVKARAQGSAPLLKRLLRPTPRLGKPLSRKALACEANSPPLPSCPRDARCGRMAEARAKELAHRLLGGRRAGLEKTWLYYWEMMGNALKPSPEQEAALERYRSGQDMKLIAVAGAGKTTTLRLMAESAPKRLLYLAFNRSIKEEVKTAEK
jgi:hypothetical protein